MNIINVVWEGPFDFEKVMEEFDRDDDEICDCGLYQIYGPHILYANKKRTNIDKVLLYIGKTVKTKFSGRIAKHGFCHGPLFEIYLGRIEGAQYDNDAEKWKNDIEDAEKMLINKYAPSYNGSSTGDLKKSQLNSPESVIVNNGKRMDLDPEIISEDVVYENN